MPGPLGTLMDALEAFYGTIHEDLTPMRWRPREYPNDTPCIWTWLPTDSAYESRTELQDQAMHRDTIFLSSFVALGPGPDGMEVGEAYIDAFGEKADQAFNQRNPLGGAVVRAQRRRMQFVLDVFGDKKPVLCVEFTSEFWLQQIHQPNP